MHFGSIEELLGAAEAAPVELGTSRWIAITQERVNGFADDTDDHQWIHVDVERAKAESPFGGPVAHGYLTLSLAAPMLFELFQVDGISAAINYGLDKVRFTNPVPVGSNLRAAATLTGVRRRAGLVECSITLKYEVEGASKSPCTAEVVLLLQP